MHHGFSMLERISSYNVSSRCQWPGKPPPDCVPPGTLWFLLSRSNESNNWRRSLGQRFLEDIHGFTEVEEGARQITSETCEEEEVSVEQELCSLFQHFTTYYPSSRGSLSFLTDFTQTRVNRLCWGLFPEADECTFRALVSFSGNSSTINYSALIHGNERRCQPVCVAYWCIWSFKNEDFGFILSVASVLRWFDTDRRMLKTSTCVL